jgi:hypothetical protein
LASGFTCGETPEISSRWLELFDITRVARFLLFFQNGKKIQKWLKNIPIGHQIFQMATK